MDSKPQKPSLLFANPLTLWTDLTFKLWGFGKPQTPEKEVAVAVIPTRDAEPPQPAKVARAQRSERPKQKARGKTKSKRTKR